MVSPSDNFFVNAWRIIVEEPLGANRRVDESPPYFDAFGRWLDHDRMFESFNCPGIV
jgi:hypothetical protein